VLEYAIFAKKKLSQYNQKVIIFYLMPPTNLKYKLKNIDYVCYHSYKDYKNYGNRGIKICEEWNEFVSFRDWALSNGYEDNLTIDRINNDGNYEPSNVKWATAKEQIMNRRNTFWYEMQGERKPLFEWCKILNVKYTTAFERTRRGREPFFREYNPSSVVLSKA
jgi:hypothetical protein